MSTEVFTLVAPDVPSSLNAGGAGSRRHWGAAHREKKKWADMWWAELEVNRVPKGMSRVEITATIFFRQRRRRDKDNYISPLLKPLQDVLVKRGYLPDDTPDFLTFKALRFDVLDAERRPLGNGETHVVITCIYP